MKTATHRMMYRLGLTPWDNGAIPPELSDLVEGPDALAPGRALDLGCGTGTHAVYLTQHGWQVTGVDAAPQALGEAERRAAAAGVAPTWITGDITHLSDIGVGSAYDLVLDVACFHGLPPGQRSGTARQITQVARTGGTLLLAAFAPAKRGPLPSGMDKDEVARLFGSDWDVLWQRRAADAPLPKFLKSADPTCYCLRKR